MNKIAVIAIAGLATVASADVLLELDLSVVNQVTITATDGLSAATISGGDNTGVYFADFFNGGNGGSVIETFVTGDLTNAENPSNGSPNLYRTSNQSSPSYTGLNMYAWSTDDTVDFTAGSLAFVGSATFGLDSEDYADMLAGNTSGDLYFPLDDLDDISESALIGQWNVVPAPGSMALLGLGGIVAGRRRR